MADDQRSKTGGSELEVLLGAAFGNPKEPHLGEESLIDELSSLTANDRDHIANCPLCRSRRILALDLLHLDGIGTPEEAASRRQRLVPMIESAVDAERSPSRLQVTMGRHSSLRVRGHDVEMRYQKSAATALRYTGKRRGHHPVSFRRTFGELEVVLELSRANRGGASHFNLAVQLAEVRTEKTSVSLSVGGRVMAVQPLRTGQATFKDLAPGNYLLHIDEQNVRVGQFEIQVRNSDGGEI